MDGLLFGRACKEGNLRLKIDWASLILGRKFTVFLCFTLYLGAISKFKPPGAYIWRGDLTEGFLCYEFGALIFGGAYLRNFTVCIKRHPDRHMHDTHLDMHGLRL